MYVWNGNNNVGLRWMNEWRLCRLFLKIGFKLGKKYAYMLFFFSEYDFCKIDGFW